MPAFIVVLAVRQVSGLPLGAVVSHVVATPRGFLATADVEAKGQAAIHRTTTEFRLEQLLVNGRQSKAVAC